MYHLSRTIYREIAFCLPAESSKDDHLRVIDACESTIRRLLNDPNHFARPAKTLFSEIRFIFPIYTQGAVWCAIERHVGQFHNAIKSNPDLQEHLSGEQIPCHATTRKGTACQRERTPGSRYCPSHQHLNETEQTDQFDFTSRQSVEQPVMCA